MRRARGVIARRHPLDQIDQRAAAVTRSDLEPPQPTSRSSCAGFDISSSISLDQPIDA